MTESPAPRAKHEEDDVMLGSRMSFGDHLMELRSRLIKSLIGLGIAVVICLIFGEHIFRFLAKPLFLALQNTDQPIQLYVTSLPEAFITYIRVSVYTAIFVASPWIFYQLWEFVAAGLYSHERRYVHVFVPFSAVLFLLGGAFCLVVMAPICCNYFIRFGTSIAAPGIEESFITQFLSKDTPSEMSPAVDSSGRPASGPPTGNTTSPSAQAPTANPSNTVNPTPEATTTPTPPPVEGAKPDSGSGATAVGQPSSEGAGQSPPVSVPNAGPQNPAGGPPSQPLIKPWFTLQDYVSFIVMMTLAFSLAFQMPLVVFVIGRLNIISIKTFKSMRKYAAFIILIAAAILTPGPDVLSQIALAIPMYILYEIGILMLVFWPKKA